jgi:hypothetical protein
MQSQKARPGYKIMEGDLLLTMSKESTGLIAKLYSSPTEKALGRLYIFV